MKIHNDKYYTQNSLAKYCVDKTNEVIGVDNISEYVDPGAGRGVFLDYFDKPFLAYDIEPEDDRVKKADWLTVDIDYKAGRCVIGNPPFGTRNTLAVRFYKKATKCCDFIAFILPIGQLNNNQQMYEFDLVYSEDLGVREYSGRLIHCCFNIYKRNPAGLNKKPKYKLKDVEITEFRSKNVSKRNVTNFDLRICFWGAATGKIVTRKGTYSHEMGITIHNETYRDKIVQLFKETNWSDIYPNVATPALYQWQIYKYLKEKIPELE